MVSDELIAVFESPCFTKQLQDCSVIEGKAARFTCCAGGDPSPGVSWYKNDEKITESRQFTMLTEPDQLCTKYVLVITRSTSDYAGCYACELTNSKGCVKSSANLHVRCSHVEEEEEGEGRSSIECAELPDKEAVVVKKESVADYFTLMEVLGRGKFGVVHKCIENKTGTEYAAKVSKCRSASQRQMNANEIDILNSLNHPLIINVIAAFEFSRQFVMILELVSGGELFERLMEDDLISERDVTFYIEQILRAAEHMHGNEILHLDLKPENILLVNKDSTQIKLIDFSVSCRTHEGDHTKALCGTRHFNPPELISYDPVSPATDMWSIGVIAYVLLAGFPPFGGETDAEISSSIVSCDWKCDDSVFDDVSTEGKHFIATLLLKEPEERATSNECLVHPWLKNVKSNEHTKKKIKTAKFVSFIARRNWKKSIAAVQATTSFLRNVTSRFSGKVGNEIVCAGNDCDNIGNDARATTFPGNDAEQLPSPDAEQPPSPDDGDNNNDGVDMDEDIPYIDVLETTEDPEIHLKEALLAHI